MEFNYQIVFNFHDERVVMTGKSKKEPVELIDNCIDSLNDALIDEISNGAAYVEVLNYQPVNVSEDVKKES